MMSNDITQILEKIETPITDPEAVQTRKRFRGEWVAHVGKRV